MTTYAWENPETARAEIVRLQGEVSSFKRGVEDRDKIIEKLVAARDASPEQKISADYLRGFQDARSTLRIWFRNAFTAMEQQFNIDLEKIPQDPGLAPLPEHLRPELVGRLHPDTKEKH